MRIHKRLLDILEPIAEDGRLAPAPRPARPASTSRSRSSRSDAPASSADWRRSPGLGPGSCASGPRGCRPDSAVDAACDRRSPDRRHRLRGRGRGPRRRLPRRPAARHRRGASPAAACRWSYVLGPEFTGYSAGADWQDAKLGAHHLSAWERAAVVSDVEWVEHLVGAFAWTIPGELRRFAPRRARRGRDWAAGIEPEPEPVARAGAGRRSPEPGRHAGRCRRRAGPSTVGRAAVEPQAAVGGRRRHRHGRRAPTGPPCPSSGRRPERAPPAPLVDGTSGPSTWPTTASPASTRWADARRPAARWRARPPGLALASAPAGVRRGSGHGSSDGKVMLVTGSASGIGAACVERFTAEGARVVGGDLGPSAAGVPPPSASRSATSPTRLGPGPRGGGRRAHRPHRRRGRPAPACRRRPGARWSTAPAGTTSSA